MFFDVPPPLIEQDKARVAPGAAPLLPNDGQILAFPTAWTHEEKSSEN
jgi:hypothetical protein